MSHTSLTVSLVGLAFQIVVWTTLNFSHPVLPFYGLVISVWVVYMLESWKRVEATRALEWGMSDFEAEEPDRTEFDGVEIDSPVDGSKVLYFSGQEFRHQIRVGIACIIAFILCVLATLAGIYVFK